MNAADTLPAPLPLPDGLAAFAADWHGGQSSALYSIASCGEVRAWRIVAGLARELRWIDAADVDDPDALAVYVEWAEQLESTNPYAAGYLPIPDPGSYMLAAVVDDGETVCETCVRDASNPLRPAEEPMSHGGDGWEVIGWTHSGEVDTPERCAHCGREWTGLELDA